MVPPQLRVTKTGVSDRARCSWDHLRVSLPAMGVSWQGRVAPIAGWFMENLRIKWMRGTPLTSATSLIIGFPMIHHPFWGTPIQKKKTSISGQHSLAIQPFDSGLLDWEAAIQHWKQKIAQNRQECEVMKLGSMGFQHLGVSINGGTPKMDGL